MKFLAFGNSAGKADQSVKWDFTCSLVMPCDLVELEQVQSVPL